MKTIMLKAVTQYQCSGCTHGSNPECGRAAIAVSGCTAHHSGTILMPGGALALGMPKGFSRFGYSPSRLVEVYESYDTMVDAVPNLESIFSLPVWKYLDKSGNTVTRWYSPRTNYGWSAVILGNHLDRLPRALEITHEQVNDMD